MLQTKLIDKRKRKFANIFHDVDGLCVEPIKDVKLKEKRKK